MPALAVSAVLAVLVTVLSAWLRPALARAVLRRITGRRVPDYGRIRALEAAENTRRELDGLREDLAAIEDTLRRAAGGAR